MKKISLPSFSFSSEIGEIATILTLATVMLMIGGIFLGTKLNKKPADITIQAVTLPTSTPTPSPVVRPNLCQSATISGTLLSSSQTLSISSTANISTITKFIYMFYNMDNLYGPNNPKPIQFVSGQDFNITQDAPSPTNTHTTVINYNQFNLPDLNNGGLKPTHLQVNAYFIDPVTGIASAPASSCVVWFNMASPTSTPTPTNTPPSPTPGIVCPRRNQGDTPEPPPLNSCNGVIDGIDYSRWLNTQCVPGPLQSCASLGADFNQDGRVDDMDYQIWLQYRNT